MGLGSSRGSNKMDLQELLGVLDYHRSPHFLTNDALRLDRDFGHLYRKAEEGCSLKGVYAIQGIDSSAPGANTPVVYVCEANSVAEADLIHRRVWNQNIVPFLLVRCPRAVRLYSGFKYKSETIRERKRAAASRGILRAAIQFNEVASVLKSFRAEAIDDGDLWQQWNKAVTPEARVDWQLLSSLDRLDGRLLANGIPNRLLAHALIGKFVYLHYLRARDILSDRKLAEWGISPDDVLSRGARLDQFRLLLRRLDEWLNGSVFPLSDQALTTIGEECLQQVAGVFRGDTPEGQQHLDFDAYDFSYIPIETLSVIYQQFLHAAEYISGRSEGRERGAYYTPVPLANFVLDTLDRRKPLKEGMRVLDPACGSGVFLVQCYRKLIEARIRENRGLLPAPEELSGLLTNHLFGIDSDPDACQVAELSLVLTLLDYVKPPDLSETDFQLPTLRNRNVFEGNSFDPNAAWAGQAYATRYDWVVGNPPWKELKADSIDDRDRPVFEWMLAHRKDCPTGGNQVAEVFAWRACELVADDGIVGLLLPAMTLFKYESAGFRAKFFKRSHLWSVANFSNLAEILFAGRSRVPAAAFFYSCPQFGTKQTAPESIEFYSPMVANQVIHDPGGPGRRKQVWAIVVNASEIRDVPYREIAGGRVLPWKSAFWGFGGDERILRSVEQRFNTIGQFEDDGILAISEGLQTRASSARERLEHHPELAGRPLLNVAGLDRRRYLFTIPTESIKPISRERTYTREGRFELPMRICQPPHVIVSAARNFAVFTSDFLVIPPRQIGISASLDEAPFLKALALYLNSDFVAYHQFFTAPEFGIKRPRGTLRSLRTVPIPFDPGANENWTPWDDLYERLMRAEEAGLARGNLEWYREHDGAELLSELNRRVNIALDLDEASRAAIYDLIHVRQALVDGQVGEAAVRPPSAEELRAYALMLQEELDAFLDEGIPARHKLTIVYGSSSAMAEVDLVRGTAEKQPVLVEAADSAVGVEFGKIRARLREKRSQWVYFERNLRMYEETRTYLFKPMQRFHWTESQALTDASSIISDTLQLVPNEPAVMELNAR
jgi:hypothetical protein